MRVRTTQESKCLNQTKTCSLSLFLDFSKWSGTSLTYMLVCGCVCESCIWERNRRKRQDQNEEWLTQIDRIIIPSHMKLYLYQSRPPWASRPADLPWHRQTAERELADSPWRRSEPRKRAVCQAFDCDDWLIMLQGSVVGYLGGWHATINERLLGATACVCGCICCACLLNSRPTLQSLLYCCLIFSQN